MILEFDFKSMYLEFLQTNQTEKTILLSTLKFISSRRILQHIVN